MTNHYRHAILVAAVSGGLFFNVWNLNAHAEQSASRPLQSQSSPAAELRVYKSPTCGCCNDWVKHLQKSNFTVAPENVSDTAAMKNAFGIDPKYRSCHTAVSKEGYVFEGHIPAKYIKQFMKDKPKGAVGLAVQAMPVGSPGMEVDSEFSPYQVLMLMKDGSHEVYANVKTYQSQF